MSFIRELAHALIWTKRHLAGQKAVPEAAPLRALVRPTDVLLDIGAHAGDWSVALSRLVPKGRVYAFEALPYYARVLRMTLLMMGRRNVQVISGAVLDEARTVELVWRDRAGNRLTGLTHIRGEGEAPDETISVEGLALDAFIVSVGGRIRFVKMDIEGAEFAALKGATRFLSDRRPLLYVEINETFCARYGYGPADLFSFLEDRRYRGYLHERTWTAVSAGDYSGKGDVWFLPIEEEAAITGASSAAERGTAPGGPS